ncbi:GtrA family protein [Pseudoxanthomonas sp.]|uniref:GtrA family protein n=1 Tax=Pseudoxanthomonas sp. TaxID=1871049 RepID=UPI0025877138|nr:GtrA family protein [Pseudoxanthomonas sp.]MCR6686503.1 GtrA family protein [Pseudoxanthomonas sp.]
MIPVQLVKFILAGGTAAAANFGARILLSLWLPYEAAIVVAYLIGMLTAFVLNRAFVFTRVENTLRSQVSWFIAINLAAVLQTLLISLLLARVLFPALGMEFHPETLAHAVGVAVPVITSYLGHRRFTFRSRTP